MWMGPLWSAARGECVEPHCRQLFRFRPRNLGGPNLGGSLAPACASGLIVGAVREDWRFVPMVTKAGSIRMDGVVAGW